MSNRKTTRTPRKVTSKKTTAAATQNLASAVDELSEEVITATRETEKLQRAMQEDRQRREQACAAAITEALSTYRCQLQPQTTIVGGQINSDVVIVAT